MSDNSSSTSEAFDESFDKISELNISSDDDYKNDIVVFDCTCRYCDCKFYAITEGSDICIDCVHIF